jgi:hypothetical protein
MRNLLIFIIVVTLLGLLSFFGWTAYKAGGQINLSKVTIEQGVEIKVDADKGEHLFEVKDGESQIKGQLITRILLGKNIVATYRNKTEESLRAIYTLKIYNNYGMLLGENVVDSGQFIEPGEVGSEDVSLIPFPVSDVLKHSNVHTAEKNLDEIKWIVISESNTLLNVSE